MSKSDDHSTDFEDDVILEPDQDTVEESGMQNKLKKVRQQLKDAHDQRDEYLTGWQKARAELVNYKKQKEQESASRAKYAAEPLVMDLLKVMDSFAMAKSNKEAWEAVDSNWRTGIEYIQSQLVAALEENGVTPINVANEPYNPTYHHALSTTETDDKSKNDMVAEVVQAGYMYHDKVIRPASVVVYAYQDSSN